MRTSPGSREFHGHYFIARIVRSVKPGDTVCVGKTWVHVIASGPCTVYTKSRSNWVLEYKGENGKPAQLARYALNPIKVSVGKVRSDGTPEDNVIHQPTQACAAA